jgi:hypothetical protein
MTWLCVASAVACAARPAAAEVLWRGDFEDGSLASWDVPQRRDVRERVTVVDAPVRQGKHAARIEIRHEDIGPGTQNRIEITTKAVPAGVPQENADVYYAWSAMAAADAPLGKGSHQIAFCESRNVWRQVLAFEVDGEQILFTTRLPYARRWSGRFTAGRWHDFVLHVKWSPDPAVGFVELWFDGAPVVPRASTQTMHVDPGTGKPAASFFAFGVLRDGRIEPAEVLYLDAVVVATTRDEAATAPASQRQPIGVRDTTTASK